MSLDVYIACAGAAMLPADLPTDVSWKSYDSGYYTTDNLQENWRIDVWVLTKPKQLEGLKLPEGTKSVVGISIQGSNKGDGIAQNVVDRISARCRGALL
ncbi:MAG: hypothetical protein QM773_11180 [Hyphomonadaceae bacterium]